MKKEGRVTLRCDKFLPCGVIDRFTVVVSDKVKNDAKLKYQAMGYNVRILSQ